MTGIYIIGNAKNCTWNEFCEKLDTYFNHAFVCNLKSISLEDTVFIFREDTPLGSMAKAYAELKGSKTFFTYAKYEHHGEGANNEANNYLERYFAKNFSYGNSYVFSFYDEENKSERFEDEVLTRSIFMETDNHGFCPIHINLLSYDAEQCALDVHL